MSEFTLYSEKNYNKTIPPSTIGFCFSLFLSKCWIGFPHVSNMAVSSEEGVCLYHPIYSRRERNPLLQPWNKSSLLYDWVNLCHMAVPGPQQLLGEWNLLIGLGWSS